jgi:hypothetical protein
MIIIWIKKRGRLFSAALLALNCPPSSSFKPSILDANICHRSPFSSRILGHERTAARMSSSMQLASDASSGVEVVPGRPTWHQTMLRIKDPSKVREI